MARGAEWTPLVPAEHVHLYRRTRGGGGGGGRGALACICQPITPLDWTPPTHPPCWPLFSTAGIRTTDTSAAAASRSDATLEIPVDSAPPAPHQSNRRTERPNHVATRGTHMRQTERCAKRCAEPSFFVISGGDREGGAGWDLEVGRLGISL